MEKIWCSLRAGAARPHREIGQISRGDDPHRRHLHFPRRARPHRAGPGGSAVRVDPRRRSAAAGGRRPGATIYTLSEKASDAEAERLAEAENRADAIGGVTMSEQPKVADILIDLAQRETRTFSNRFARVLKDEMKGTCACTSIPLNRPASGCLKRRRALRAGRTRLCLQQGRSSYPFSTAGARARWVRWRRPSMPSWPSAWWRPDRRIESGDRGQKP